MNPVQNKENLQKSETPISSITLRIIYAGTSTTTTTSGLRTKKILEHVVTATMEIGMDYGIFLNYLVKFHPYPIL